MIRRAAGARETLDVCTRLSEAGCGPIHHPVDACGVRRLALSLDPGRDSRQQHFGIRTCHTASPYATPAGVLDGRMPSSPQIGAPVSNSEMLCATTSRSDPFLS